MSGLVDIRTGEPFYDDKSAFRKLHPHHRDTLVERASTGGARGGAV